MTRVDTRIGLALVFAVFVQAAAVFLWTGRASERLDAVERRLDEQHAVSERLARLEVRADDTHAALERIERRLDQERR